MRNGWSMVMAAGALMIGCGSSSDDGGAPAAQQGTVNKGSAVQSTQQTITAMTQIVSPSGAAPDGQGSASSLAGAGTSAQNMVQPSAGATATKSFGFPLLQGAGAVRPMADGTATGTCTCDANACTFVACNYGGLTIDGTYSYGGGHVKCTDLKYTYDAAQGGISSNLVMTLECDLTVTATTLDGTFHSKGTSGGSYGGYTSTSSWDDTITFHGVTFPSGGGAPSGGSEHVDGTYSTVVTGTGSADANQSWGGSFDVSFPSSG